MCLVINLFGGPGTGKSTLAARIFSELKIRGFLCELITEYAKDKIWEQSLSVLKDQIYIFGKQQHRQFIVKHKVDIIITDSPIPLILYYSKYDSYIFKKLVLEIYNSYNNLNYLLSRSDEIVYNKIGRNESLSEAIIADKGIEDILLNYNKYVNNPTLKGMGL
jgi:tRNA uridine 5-carbamoylmethylation protein Kti12